MKVICAGFPKTGTKSMASALRFLGYSVHDIEEHWDVHMDEYVQALDGKTLPDFAAMYADVDSITDVPACLFWEDIYKAFPDAKVVLMVRENEEVWYKSMAETYEMWESYTTSKPWIVAACLITPTGRKLRKVMRGVMHNKLTLGNANPSSSILKEAYTSNNARAETIVPREKLLVFNAKQGWKPLCEFLGAEVPDVPFPRRNVKSSYVRDVLDEALVAKKMLKELAFCLSMLLIIVSVFMFKIIKY